MEIETSIVHFDYTSVSNVPINLGATNKVSIFLKRVIQDQITGNERVLRSDHIRLNPPHGGFTRKHLTGLLLDQQVTEFIYVGARIARDIELKLASDIYLREPVYVTANVNFIKQRRLIPPRPPVLPAPSRGAPREVFEKLAEEESVEPKDLEEKSETRCSICIGDFSKSSHEKIIEMPPCLHMFHENCLFEWLRRQNSYPLCRRVPYE